MPRLPDATTLGQRPVPESTRPTGGYTGGIAEQGQIAEGQALAGFGQQVAKAGDQIFDAQDSIAQARGTTSLLNAKLAADEAARNDPDYTTLPQRYQQTLIKARDEAASGIMSPVARASFIAQSSYQIGRGVDGVQTLAHGKSVQADRDWLNQFTQGSVDGFTKATTDEDRNQYLTSAHDAIDAMRVKGSITASEAQAARKTVGGTAVKQNVEMLMARNDPAAAQQFFTKYADQVDPADRVAIETKLHPMLLQQQAMKEANDKYLRPLTGAAPFNDMDPSGIDKTLPPGLTGKVTHRDPTAFNDMDASGIGRPPAAGAGVPVSAVTAAIAGQESGGNPNAPTSVNGAVGGMQITPATFQQYAKPGEDINNPADNKAVGQRIISDLYDKTGGDPARVAVGYFSGPGNIAPAGSPTPWIRDVSDGNGKSVSSYVQDVSSRLGPSATGKAAMLYDRAGVLSQVDRDYRDNPQLGAKVRQYVNEQYTIANTAIMADAAQKKDAQDAVHKDFVSSILTAKPADLPGFISKIAADKTLTGPQQENLAALVESHMKSDVDGDAKRYGPGIWDAIKAVDLPVGDPKKITDASQVVAMGGADGQLTVAGVDHVLAKMTEKRTLDGEARAMREKAFYAGVEQMIAGKDAFGKEDPRGKAIYSDWLNTTLTEATTRLKAGEDPATVYATTDKNPLYVSATKAVRPMSVWLKDNLKDKPQAEAPAENGAVDLTSQDGIVAAAKSGRITRDRAAQLLRPMLEKATPPAAPLPAPPLVGVP